MELFIGPWNQAANWSVEGMGGSFRFLQRVWAITQEYLGDAASRQSPVASQDDVELKRIMHRAIYRVSKDLEGMGFNTAIAALMETVNDLYKHKVTHPLSKASPWKEAIDVLLQLLAPFAPHITEELWAQLGHEGSIHASEWPVHDEQYLVRDTMTIVVQINGKVRSQLTAAADATEESILAAAKADQKVAGYLKGKDIKKSIYVPKKLISFVVR